LIFHSQQGGQDLKNEEDLGLGDEVPNGIEGERGALNYTETRFVTCLTPKPSMSPI